jgi:hypothetical protein
MEAQTAIVAPQPVESPVLTPDWVKDAVFYHIFPDRFAISAASRSHQTWSPGRPRRPHTASKAAICWGWSTTSTISPTSA